MPKISLSDIERAIQDADNEIIMLYNKHMDVWAWLGMWRDKIPAKAVVELQDILPPPEEDT